MDRKTFIQTCGYACMAGTALAAVMQSCVGNQYLAQSTFENKRIKITKSEFIKIHNDKTSVRDFVLVKHAELDFPICIYRIGDENYTALYMQCTHKGCELKAQPAFLICPCHGSEFNNQGMVQNPPAEDNLTTFKTSFDNENVYIHL